MLEPLPRETACSIIIERTGLNASYATWARRCSMSIRPERAGTIRVRRETWTWARVQMRNGTPGPGDNRGLSQFFESVQMHLCS